MNYCNFISLTFCASQVNFMSPDFCCLVAFFYSEKNGFPTTHRRHMGRGRCLPWSSAHVVLTAIRAAGQWPPNKNCICECVGKRGVQKQWGVTGGGGGERRGQCWKRCRWEAFSWHFLQSIPPWTPSLPSSGMRVLVDIGSDVEGWGAGQGWRAPGTCWVPRPRPQLW